ncbi:hypothetical protein EsH8_V_001085 [Colletotrichum jinshuiense]
MAVMKSLTFIFAMSLAVGAVADGGDDFSNNLFSDLAPILALFGERFTMQFISQSTGWADNIILAMAPLGIITIIVSAIRVGGPSWLKAIIGRARENLAAAEQDVMSSTSTEVCELWNGREVVKCMGSASIAEFIFLLPSNRPTNGNRRHGDSETVVPEVAVVTMTLQQALENGHIKMDDFNGSSNQDSHVGKHTSQTTPNDSTVEKGEAPATSSTSDIIIVRNVTTNAPNISLNSQRQDSKAELWAVAVIGTILQLGVVAFAGFATYYPTLKFLKDDRPIVGYAFPCNAIGTLVLVAGMLQCAHIVDSRTEEKRYRPAQGKDTRLVWLQRTKTVSDQVFASFALFARDKRDLITTSYRENSHPHVVELKTIVATVVGLCGFIVQFIGLRAMHWSASVAQLGAIVVMTCFRAWVRRELSKPLQFQGLDSEFELDWFSIWLRDVGNARWGDMGKPTIADWSLESPRMQHEKLNNEPSESINQIASNAHRIMKIRRDLGKLAGWPGPASAEAISVARAMEITMDALFGSYDKSFTWSIRSTDAQTVKFRLTRKDKRWKAHSDEIEAALSLWLYTVHRHEHDEEGESTKAPAARNSDSEDDDTWLREKGPAAESSLRLLGPDTEALRQDLKWWMPTEASRIMTVSECDDGEGLEVRNNRIIGHGNLSRSTKESGPHATSRFMTGELAKPSVDSGNHVGGEQNARSFLATESHKPLKLLYAQDMFSAFMWAVAKTQSEPIEGSADLRPDDSSDSNAWQSFTLRNDRLSAMAQDIKSTGLGSLEEIYLNIIPPLSGQQKLPQVDTPIVEWARKHAKRYEQFGDWKEAGDAYLWLFRTAGTSGKKAFIVKATAVLMECLRQVTLAVELSKSQQEINRFEQLERLQSTLVYKLKSTDQETLSNLMGLYEKQGRKWECPPALELRSSRLEEDICSRLFNFTRLHEATYSDGLITTHGGENVNVKDIHGWTPLHYAVINTWNHMYKRYNIEKLLEGQADCNAWDLLEWTPLHYACQRDDPLIVRILLQKGADVNAQGRNGVAPLHCAARTCSLNVVTALVEAGATIDILDASGNTPLLWAAYMGHKDVVAYLWEDANRKLRNKNGRTTMHLAAVAGKEEMIKWLHNQSLADNNVKNAEAALDTKDSDGRTPLHLASANGHDHVVRLLIELGADKEAKDNDGQTPLHLASANGHDHVVRLLIELGANKEAKDNHGQTPLHQTSREGKEATTRLLIELGADKEAKDKNGRTPLHWAAIAYGGETTTRLLIELGADKEAKDNDGQTPLHLASANGHDHVVRLLIELGADKEAKDNYGQTPLHQASREGKEATTWLLIELGADKDAMDNNGRTPLHYAATEGEETTLKLLVELGADIEVKDNIGLTALYWAVMASKDTTIKLLIKLGADMEAKDNDGRTLLHGAAIAYGGETTTRLLIELGADKEAKDNDGQTPLHLASANGHDHVVRLLIELGADKEAKDNAGRTPTLNWL